MSEVKLGGNVVRGETPPFADLVGFAPLAPAEPAPSSPTLGARWARLSPRWQAGIVSVGLAVVAGGAVAFSPQAGKEIVRVGEPLPAPPSQPSPPPPAPIVFPHPLPKYVFASKAIPVNFRVTEATLATHFSSMEVGKAPKGALLEVESLLGQYAQRALNTDQLVNQKDFAPQAVSVAREPEAVREIAFNDTHGKRVARYEMWDGEWTLVSTK